MASSKTPDYYSLLEISSTASPDEIRTAYKRAALKTHPDRLPPSSPDRAARTHKFQLINDAYYTLSDPSRRRAYDATRRTHGPSAAAAEAETEDEEEMPRPGGGGGSWWESFGFNTSPPPTADAGSGSRAEAESAQFGDVFEEMLREEGLASDANEPTGKFWSVVGGLSGGAMGFIVGNFAGLLAGAVAGNRLGSVRDARGKSVYEVYQELDPGAKMRLLGQLAAKVFAAQVAK